jgi:hypothetical protein
LIHATTIQSDAEQSEIEVQTGDLKMISKSAKATFSTTANNLKRDKLSRLLASVVAATLADAAKPYGYLPEKDAAELVAANSALVEVNATVKNEAGEVAVHATTAGVTASNEIAAEAAANKATETPSLKMDDFQIEDAISIPEIKRGGAGALKYPFEKLGVGQSFFVPGKSIASTVNSANKRYKTETPARHFAIRKDSKDGVAGSRVWREQ